LQWISIVLQVFQLFHIYVTSVSSKCFKSISEYYTCCNVTHHATTGCCSCLDAVHVHGGTKGWSTARQRAREAEGDGSRGAGSPYVACWCGKLRRRGRKAEGARGSEQRHEVGTHFHGSSRHRRQAQKQTAATGVRALPNKTLAG
jgi:hypothetical protein